MYVCPKEKAPLIRQDEALVCKECGAIYPVEDGVPVFSDKENQGYWSNVPREVMRSVIRRSEETGDWRRVMREDLAKKYERHIAPYFRGDIQYFFPTNSKSVLLDAGSMWGGVTLPVAQQAARSASPPAKGPADTSP